MFRSSKKFAMSTMSLMGSKNLNNMSINKSFFKLQKNFVATKRHNTYFDVNMDHYFKQLVSSKIPFAVLLAFVNVGLFLYVNAHLARRRDKKFQALRSVSFSVNGLHNRDYIPLFASLLGSYRVEDLILETGVLMTIGLSLEKLHGTPFMLKLFLFSFYIGFLSSLYWVHSNWAKRSRYHVQDPKERVVGTPNAYEYRFMSGHGFAMSLVYFYLYKNPSLRKLIPLVVGADLFVWGPYYASGALTGLAAGLIL